MECQREKRVCKQPELRLCLWLFSHAALSFRPSVPSDEIHTSGSENRIHFIYSMACTPRDSGDIA